MTTWFPSFSCILVIQMSEIELFRFKMQCCLSLTELLEKNEPVARIQVTEVARGRLHEVTCRRSPWGRCGHPRVHERENTWREWPQVPLLLGAHASVVLLVCPNCGAPPCLSTGIRVPSWVCYWSYKHKWSSLGSWRARVLKDSFVRTVLKVYQHYLSCYEHFLYWWYRILVKLPLQFWKHSWKVKIAFAAAC